MEAIGKYIKKARAAQHRGSERNDLLDYFVRNVNLERDGKKYKKLGYAAMAYKLQALKVPDLYYLKSICEDARRRGEPWGRVFWGSLKDKPAGV
jgi:hypothetical protein